MCGCVCVVLVSCVCGFSECVCVGVCVSGFSELCVCVWVGV